MKIILFLLASLLFIAKIYSQDMLIIEAEYIPYPDTTLVFTPNDYVASKSYPLVILLHGWSANYKQWNNIADMQKYSNEYGFIIATPDGFYDSWYIDNPKKKNVQFEKFFWNDFIPKMYEEYNIDSSKIFISGLSMGGHGAMTLMLKNPDFFLSAGSMSGILDLTFFPDRWSIKEGIGSIKKYPEKWKLNSAYYLLGSIAGLDKHIIFDCGTEDFSYEVNNKFRERCRDLNIKATFISQPGKHNYEYWEKSIDDHFRFFDELIES